MRIKTLRSLALASIFLLLDFSFPELLFIGYDIFPDVIGLVFVLFCCGLLIDKSSSFARPVIICILMLFMETVRIFRLADDPIVVQMMLLVYLFLKALLFMFILEAEAHTSRSFGSTDQGALADRIGLLYALTFPLRVGEMFLPELQGIFWLIGLSLAVLTFAVLFYLYTCIHLPPQETAENEDIFEDEGEEEEASGEDSELIDDEFYNQIFSDEDET